MPITVVTESHITGDDYGKAASPEDIQALEQQIKSLTESVLLRVTETTLSSEIGATNAKIEKMNAAVQIFKKELLEALENGAWKTSFFGNIEEAVTQLERRYSDLNSSLDKKMDRLPRIDVIEADINAIFIAHAENIKNIISSEGKRVRRELEEQARRADLFLILQEEAQNISWETNHD